jgi:hypothetical protein
MASMHGRAAWRHALAAGRATRAAASGSSARDRIHASPRASSSQAGRLWAPSAAATASAASSAWQGYSSAEAAAYCALSLLAGRAAFGAAAAICEAPPAPAEGAGEAVDDSGTWFVEPESGTLFPLQLSDGETLVAAGVRLMTPLKVQVYSLGLYVDVVLGNLLLSRWVGASPERVLSDRAFWDKLSSPSSDMRRTLRMQVVREVSGRHMQSGFDRGLVWRVKHAARRMDMPGGKEALRTFNAAFRDAGILREGSEILIRCLGQGRLQLCIEGRPAVDLDSPALVWALLQMFFGEKSVAPNVKERVAEGFSTLLESVV